MFKISLIAIILSFLLTFMYDHFTMDYIDVINRFEDKEDRAIIKNVFRVSIFCMLIMSFMFYGFILKNIN